MAERLPRPLEPLIDQRAPRNAQQMWRNIERLRQRRAAPKPAPRWRLLVASFALLLAAGLGLQHWLEPTARAPGPLLSAQRRALPASIAPVTGYTALDVSDGSRITVGSGARLDVLESSGRSVSFLLREGRARFDIRPRGPRTWRVDCGVLSVEVVGTAFVIERRGGKVRVEVLRGAVLVRGAAVPDGVARLDVGQSFESAESSAALPARRLSSEEPSQGALTPTGADASDPLREQPGTGVLAPPLPAQSEAPGAQLVETGLVPDVEPIAPADAPALADPPAAVPGPAQPTPEDAVEGPARPKRGLEVSAGQRPVRRRQGASKRAASAVAPSSPSGAPPSESEVDVLFRQADGARRAGQAEQARDYLQAIVDQHAADPRASLAAFALARLQLGQLRSPVPAVASLRRALALGLPTALHEDAHAKLVQALERAGDVAAACAARADYAQRFPRGHALSEPLQPCRTASHD